MLVAGVGPGLFALIFITVICLLIGVVVAFLRPHLAVPVGIGALVLPLLVFGLIMAAPAEGARDNVLTDHLYVPRIIFIILMCLGALMGPGYYMGVLVVGAPKYQVPDIACRRKKIGKMHPEWVK